MSDDEPSERLPAGRLRKIFSLISALLAPFLATADEENEQPEPDNGLEGRETTEKPAGSIEPPAIANDGALRLLDEYCTDKEFVKTDDFFELSELLDRRSITVGLAGHRGSGKSAILQIAFDEKVIDFNNFSFERQFRKSSYDFRTFLQEKSDSIDLQNRRDKKPFKNYLLDILGTLPGLNSDAARVQMEASLGLLKKTVLF